jgi:inner membrane protein
MSNKLKFDSLVSKVLIIIGLLMASTLPRFYVDDLIADRQGHQNQAIESVVSGWAARHHFGEIKLSVPYHYFVEINSNTKKQDRVDESLNLDPVSEKIEIKDTIDTRHRGIYTVPIYKADLVMTGTFEIPKILDGKVKDAVVSENEQSLAIETKQSMAISEFEFTLNGEKVQLRRINKGFKLRLRNKTFKPGEKVSFKFTARLNGYEGMDIAAHADELEIKIDSAWPNPSFKGQLPLEQNVGKSGFTARWKLIQASPDQPVTIDYIEPVNIYSQANRALKYGMFITLLALTTLFTIETLSGFTIHPMQYLLMILPLSVFYVLLIALAEQIGFGLAYALASVSVISLLHIYFKGIGAPGKMAWSLSGLLAVVYSMISSMLSSEDYALLIGAVALFACLAAFMLLTRKLDWSKGIVQRHEQI